MVNFLLMEWITFCEYVLTLVIFILSPQNKLGDTALHAAAWKGYADIVEMLLAKGTDPSMLCHRHIFACSVCDEQGCFHIKISPCFSHLDDAGCFFYMCVSMSPSFCIIFYQSVPST